jgi:hypothetical protein
VEGPEGALQRLLDSRAGEAGRHARDKQHNARRRRRRRRTAVRAVCAAAACAHAIRARGGEPRGAGSRLRRARRLRLGAGGGAAHRHVVRSAVREVTPVLKRARAALRPLEAQLRRRRRGSVCHCAG